jgi:mono/diheme cytochrome c family protein
LKWGAILFLVVLVAIQFVPYGRDNTNPTGGHTIAWDSPRTQQLMAGACMDCHSNETKWPWYSNVAPISWLIQKDVEDGRNDLNLSTGQGDPDEMIEAIREGSMPPWQYKPLHPDARLSSQEKQDLIDGLQATFSAASGGGKREAT